MTEIQNPKHVQIYKNKHSKSVWVIGYWNLRFVCNLVLEYCFLHKMQRNNN